MSSQFDEFSVSKQPELSVDDIIDSITDTMDWFQNLPEPVVSKIFSVYTRPAWATWSHKEKYEWFLHALKCTAYKIYTWKVDESTYTEAIHQRCLALANKNNKADIQLMRWVDNDKLISLIDWNIPLLIQGWWKVFHALERARLDVKENLFIKNIDTSDQKILDIISYDSLPWDKLWTTSSLDFPSISSASNN
jgi:hypothetical protein